jgi:hypothetical protein
MNDVAVTRYLTLRVGVERAFDVVSAEDVLPSVLKRFGPIPAVKATADLSGPWRTPGASRTVLLSDGGSVHEELTDYERPAYFAYRVTGFPPPFGRLVRSARGRWWFAGDESRTLIRWTYSFEPATSGLPLWLAAHVLWRGSMRRAMGSLGHILSDEPER